MKNLTQLNQINKVLIAIALLFLLFTSFAKVGHWPFAFEMRLIGFLVVGFLYGTRYSLKVDKTIKDRTKAYMIFSFVMVEVLSMLGIKSIIYFVYFALACGLVWLILELIDKLKSVKSEGTLNIVLNVGLTVLIYYVLSRFLFWPLSMIPFMIGVFLTSIGFFIAHFSEVKAKKD